MPAAPLTATYTAADADRPGDIYQRLAGVTPFRHVDGRRSTLDEARRGHPVAVCGAVLWPAAHFAILAAGEAVDLECARCAKNL